MKGWVEGSKFKVPKRQLDCMLHGTDKRVDYLQGAFFFFFFLSILLQHKSSFPLWSEHDAMLVVDTVTLQRMSALFLFF